MEGEISEFLQIPEPIGAEFKIFPSPPGFGKDIKHVKISMVRLPNIVSFLKFCHKMRAIAAVDLENILKHSLRLLWNTNNTKILIKL